jgi:hypothetical protein
LATVSAPILPLAPERFSTMTRWPSRSLKSAARKRATMSGAPPAGNGTTMTIGRVGQDWAVAAHGTQMAAIAAAQASQSGRRATILDDLARSIATS